LILSREKIRTGLNVMIQLNRTPHSAVDVRGQTVNALKRNGFTEAEANDFINNCIALLPLLPRKV
jgi:hypothetical protein